MKLDARHYQEKDWKPVRSMDIGPTKNGGLIVKYFLDVFDADGNQEVAVMFYNPWSGEAAKRIYQANFFHKTKGNNLYYGISQTVWKFLLIQNLNVFQAYFKLSSDFLIFDFLLIKKASEYATNKNRFYFLLFLL